MLAFEAERPGGGVGPAGTGRVPAAAPTAQPQQPSQGRGRVFDPIPEYPADPNEVIQALNGFKVEIVARADRPKQGSWISLTEDDQGRLILPPEGARRYGLTPGAKVRVDNDNNVVRLHRPTLQLTRLYVEPTDHCNLDCVTCYRNNWAEALGRMTDATYARVLDGIKDLDPKPTIFFGGIGEPTLHTHLPDWIAQAKRLAGL